MTKQTETQECFAFSDSPWMQIELARIERIEYPPTPIPPLERDAREPPRFIGLQAICVVLKNGGELWSTGDRSWRERERQKRIHQASVKLMLAQEELRKAVGNAR